MAPTGSPPESALLRRMLAPRRVPFPRYALIASIASSLCGLIVGLTAGITKDNVLPELGTSVVMVAAGLAVALPALYAMSRLVPRSIYSSPVVWKPICASYLPYAASAAAGAAFCWLFLRSVIPGEYAPLPWWQNTVIISFTAVVWALLGLIANRAQDREERLSQYLGELKEYSERLAREHRTLAAIQSSMAEGLVVIDPVGRIMYFNEAAAALTGLVAEETLGNSIEEVLRLKAADFESAEALEALLGVIGGSTEAPTTVEVTLLRPQRWELSATAFPIPAGPGERMTGLLIRDATQERDLERRRNAFVSVASHEMRTPMTTITGFAELLLGQDPPKATRRQWVERIHRGSQALTAIVDDMLNVSRIQSGKISVNLVHLPLHGVVEEVLTDVRPTTDKHDFVVDIAPDTPEVVADGDKLAQVLTNLLDNAVKYSPEGGRITVSARHEPERERVVVSVADQGMGIAPEDRQRLFTTFGRIRRPETEGVKGTGLGLYIVKQLVELMEGDVWVESELDNGSTFFISLPTRRVD